MLAKNTVREIAGEQVVQLRVQHLEAALEEMISPVIGDAVFELQTRFLEVVRQEVRLPEVERNRPLEGGVRYGCRDRGARAFFIAVLSDELVEQRIRQDRSDCPTRS